MNKPPAFQFYADDFLGGTCDMTTEEVGAYIRLLCYQWNTGSTPVQPERCRMIAGVEVTEHVMSKFPIGQDGKRRNERLEKERAKQAIYREKQAEKGRKSGEARRTTVEPRLNHGSNPVGFRFEPEANSPSPSPSTKGGGVHQDVQTRGVVNGSHPPSLVDREGGISRADRISAERELVRVEKRISQIKAGYSEHQSLDEKDRNELKLLRERSKDLKKRLNYIA